MPEPAPTPPDVAPDIAYGASAEDHGRVAATNPALRRDDAPPAVESTTAAIVGFLRDIGLDVEPGVVADPTFLPGIAVRRGVIVFDPERLAHPGDLLHEAGHLAVKLPADRAEASEDMGSDPAEEMMAIAWSYAAVREPGMPPQIVFHADGYRGGSQSLIENFGEGRFLAVPMLAWAGMTYDVERARELGVSPYPHMRRWLRPS